MMSPEMQPNEKMKAKNQRQLVRIIDEISLYCSDGSQNATEPIVQFQVSLETYNALSRMAMAQGISVEELVANVVSELADADTGACKRKK